MLERLLIAGSGGQGVILTGKLVASAALETVPHLTFFPAYGAEVRGGTSNCQVVLSSREINSPVPEEFDSMILMNQASLDRFADYMRDGCLTLINASMCTALPTAPHVPVDAAEAAARLGDTRIANMIMLGAYLAQKPLVLPASIESSIAKAFDAKGRSLSDLNIRAFRTGLNA